MEPDLVLNHGADGDRYLTRWNLGYKWDRFLRAQGCRKGGTPRSPHHTSRTALVHHIEGPDPDRAPHNHPWPAIAIVLWGGYDQLVSARPATWRTVDAVRWAERLETVRWFNVLRVDEYHRIIRVRPNTWTITFTGRLLPRGWGFLVNGQHVDHKPYLLSNQDDA